MLPRMRRWPGSGTTVDSACRDDAVGAMLADAVRRNGEEGLFDTHNRD